MMMKMLSAAGVALVTLSSSATALCDGFHNIDTSDIADQTINTIVFVIENCADGIHAQFQVLNKVNWKLNAAFGDQEFLIATLGPKMVIPFVEQVGAPSSFAGGMICCMLEKGLLKYTWFCNYNLLELILEL
jgi:hypothetical protein